MNRPLLLLAFLLFTSRLLLAQQVKVIDQHTLQPLLTAAITNSQGETMYADDKGKFDFTQLKGDSLTIQATGYQPVRVALQAIKDQLFIIKMAEKRILLNEVVVSANKFGQPAEDVPQQIRVVREKELQFMNQPTTADVLQQLGSVLVQKSQLGGGSPIIRGFEANKILMVVDGVRMNNAIYRGGHLQNSITMDNALLEKVEVVFGAGSVMYGSDALGGVIHFQTKNPRLSTGSEPRIGANAFTRYSTAAHEKTGHLDFNIGFKKLAFLTAITYSDFDDLRQGAQRNTNMESVGKRSFYARRIQNKDSMVANSDPNVQKYSGYQQVDFLQKILLQQNAKTSHVLNFQYSTSSDIPRYDRLTEVTGSGILKNAEWYYGPQKRLLASYQLTLKANQFFTNARITAAYQQIEESRHNRSFGKTQLGHRIEHVYVSTINADFNKSLGKHDLYYGLDGAFNNVNSTAYATDITNGTEKPLDTRYPDGGSTMQTLAAYVTHSWKIAPKLTLTEGIRYSVISLRAKFDNKQFFPFPFDEVHQQAGAFNGNAGLVWQPGNDWRFTVLGNSGFRAPNVDDLAKVFESVAGNLIVPNPNLKPEFTYNGELSITKTIAERLQLGVLGYYTTYRNAITTQPFQLNGQDFVEYNGKSSRVTANVNAGKAYLYGGSLNAAIELSKSLFVTSSLTYTYGRIRTDSSAYPLDHIPPVFGKTSLRVNVQKMRAEFFVLYNGWKHLKNYNRVGEDNLIYATSQGTPAWYTLNIRSSYQVGSALQVQLALENILDRNYRVFASGISAPGRNLVLSLRGSF